MQVPPTSWLVFVDALAIALSSPVFRIIAMIDAASTARRIGAIVPTLRSLVYFLGSWPPCCLLSCWAC